MVSTQTPEERIKQLLDEQDKKKKELDEKKAELEKRKRELDELEAKQKKEAVGTKRTIDEQLEELAVEEREAFEAQEKQRVKQASLEETVKESDTKSGVNEIMQGNAGFYQVTNYNVVGTLDNLASAAQQRPLTHNEREFLDAVQYHAERLQRDDFYKDKQGAQYLSQELAQIDFINKLAKGRDYQ